MSDRKSRFAILCRVSTPKQKEKETPLKVQIQNCEKHLSSLGGRITARYIGQEHSTPGNTRELFDAMLRDAKAGNKVMMTGTLSSVCLARVLSISQFFQFQPLRSKTFSNRSAREFEIRAHFRYIYVPWIFLCLGRRWV